VWNWSSLTACFYGTYILRHTGDKFRHKAALLDTKVAVTYNVPGFIREGIGLPRVSAIIPTYNAPHFLVQAVESALAQDYRDYELIVIDDGSGPETHQALEPYMDRIRYIYQENAGPSAARNRGIRESTGELLAFLDHDDLWLPGKLTAQVENSKRQGFLSNAKKC
jgi:hypothetical protein